MPYCAEYCLEMPDDFPTNELVAFMSAARGVLLDPSAGPEWSEFGGASNLIGWRFRASSEHWGTYKRSWQEYGSNVNHEGIYERDRALFGMFSSGVACIESTIYALAALSSHPRVLSLKFGPREQRACSPKQLLAWIAPLKSCAALTTRLSSICTSSEWQLWVDLRNRMSHRSNLPRITFGAVGGDPPPAKALHFAATTSTPVVEGELESFDALHYWLTQSLRDLLLEGVKLCPA